MALALLASACDDIEPEPEVDQADLEEEADEIDTEEVDAVDEKEEEINGELVFMLPPTAGNLAASPKGDYLAFTMAGAPIDPYHIINTETYQSEICDDRGIYWGEIEYLPTPGLEYAQVKAPHFSPDGEKLLYMGYEVFDYEYVNAVIYLCNLGLPLEAESQVDLSDDEVIPGIRPVWKADGEGIYYLTTKGVISYSPENQQAEIIYSASDLSGPLVQNNRLAPHSFHVINDKAMLAFNYEDKIEIVSLDANHSDLELFETGLSDISSIELIFDGRYIVLESAYMYDIEGHWLEFLDLRSGELVELDNNYLPAGYAINDQQEMAFIRVNEPGDYELAILNESLEEAQTADIPWLTGNVIWLDSAWCMLGRGQEGYPLYKVEFE